MKRFFVRILDYIRPRRPFILYALAAIMLLGLLAAMVSGKYSAHKKNMLLAEENNQLVVFELESGNEIGVEELFSGKPKTEEHNKTATTPTPPIKQADIMFIIDNLGANKANSERAIELPKEFILAFSPYADLSLELSKSAYDKGHMTLADLPVQLKEAGEIPGNLALNIENNDFKNSRNLDAVLSKIYQPAGVLTPPGDIFTHSNNFNAILHQISQHKIFLAYAGEGEDIDTRAHDNDVELLKVDLVLTDDAATLEKQLANAETIIAKTGLAVVMIKSPSLESIEEIRKWAEGLKTKNIRLVSSAK